jgi:hypothetical protein
VRYPSYELTEDQFRAVFPRLNFTVSTITSDESPLFNCIAYAADDDQHWWWPTSHWPIAWREEAVDCFIAAFCTLRYLPCRHGDLEHGYEKVALYTDGNRTPTHMAKQRPDGIWISKCGPNQDIQHSPEELHSPLYGRVHTYLCRPIQGYPGWKRKLWRAWNTLTRQL